MATKKKKTGGRNTGSSDVTAALTEALTSEGAAEALVGLLSRPDSAAGRALQEVVRKHVVEQMAGMLPTAPPQTPGGGAPPAPPAKPPSGQGGGSNNGSDGSNGGDGGTGESDSFDPRQLDHAVIAIPLAEAMDAVEKQKPLPAAVRFYAGGPDATEAEQDKAGQFPVIIDLNFEYPGGRVRAKHRVYDLLVRVFSAPNSKNRTLLSAIPKHLRDSSAQFVFADLFPGEIRELVRLDNGWRPVTQTGSTDLQPRRSRKHMPRAIFRVWPSHSVQALLTKSISTVKADAATATFGASGRDIVWAVMDSGIDGSHRHFKTHGNLSKLPPGVTHQDFSGAPTPAPLRDVFGHGTHVAGIIAGTFQARPNPVPPETAVPEARVLAYLRDERGQSAEDTSGTVHEIRGVAPECKLVSYKVLNDRGQNDDVRNIIAALEHIGNVNEHGLNPRIHGVNLSLGYPFDPKWFACGHSPLCQVIDRLVRAGVVVVAAAGNSGYAYVQSVLAGLWAQGAPLSINDPGNAETAITVGSTHREEPYRYGASYFSSKGPTGDGRIKPDILAPGEKIISCASFDWSQYGQRADPQPPDMATLPARPEYREESGTSMAAPHVSGAVAAFLSIRREFIGRPEVVKDIFLKSASDLGRDRYLQGHGLLDLLRALQSV